MLHVADQVADLTKHVRYGLMSPEGLEEVRRSQFGANTTVKKHAKVVFQMKTRSMTKEVSSPRIPYEIVLVVGGWES